MTTKTTKSEREKTKLEIAKLISQNDEFLEKIKHYRSIVNHTISAGCEDYCIYVDTSTGGNLFMVMGTKNDIKPWCDRQGFVFEDVSARNVGASGTADFAVTEIMSFRLLQWIDEEIYLIYHTYSDPYGYHNTKKNRTKSLSRILEERIDDTITHYITRHIFWASPCKAPITSFLVPENENGWMVHWCNIPLPEIAEAKAEADYEEGANIALSHPNNKAMTKKAITKLKAAVEYYHICGMTRQAALGSALIAGLSAKLRNRQDILSHAGYAVAHLDKALDRELINNCKGLLFYRDSDDIATLPQTEFAIDWITKKQETSKLASPSKEVQMVQVYRTNPEFVNSVRIAGYLGTIEESKISMDYIGSLWGGGIYQIQYIAKDKNGHTFTKSRQHISIQGDPKPGTVLSWKAGDNTNPDIGPPLNKPHILVTKPPITVSLNAEEAYQNIKPKKRSEATKKTSSTSKTRQPAPCEREIEFVKAAVLGKLFRDTPEEPE